MYRAFEKVPRRIYLNTTTEIRVLNGCFETEIGVPAAETEAGYMFI